MKAVIRGEKGAGVLALVLVLLVVGGLILTPLLGLMGTGLMAGKVYEKKTDELYAADAGVEDAIWRITHESIPTGSWQTCDDRPGWQIYEYAQLLSVGNKSVGVAVYRKDWDPTCGENFTYEILSTAVTDDGGGTAAIGSSTLVDAYLVVSYLDLANLLDNAIVSDNFVLIYNGVNVAGNVTSGGLVDNKAGGAVNGTITENAALTWPTTEDLSAYYWDDVDSLQPPFPYTDPLKIAGTDITLDALYREGSWSIYNDSNNPGTLTLEGTVYVKGNLQMGTEKNDFTLNLNGQTIFVESPNPKYAIDIGDRCAVTGSGCIIAVGGVYFGPKGDAGSEADFVLVMSVEGNTELHPSGTFYGCVAGNASVTVHQGTNATITHTAPEGKGLNFPMGPGDYDKLPPVTGLRIESWEINPQ